MVCTQHHVLFRTMHTASPSKAEGKNGLPTALKVEALEPTRPTAISAVNRPAERRCV